MKKRNFVIFLLFFVILTIPFLKATNVNAQDINDLENLKAFFEGYIQSQMEEYKVPGVTLSIVKDGEILLEEGYGYYDLENKKRVNPQTTLFRPGSGSKLFIWTAVMQLVEKGEISLEENINNYLDFEIPPKVSGMDTQEVNPITMMNLMNHTAGFEETLKEIFVLSEEDINPLGDYLKEHRPARVFQVGEQIAYSNYGSALAAYIVESVSGMPFYEYVEKNIFNPLKMNRSTFRKPVPSEIEGELAYGYAHIQGAYQKDQYEYIQPYPAGSLSSTASDMAKFMLAHLNEGIYDGVRILESETVRKMHSRSFTAYDDFAGMAHGFIEMNYNGHRIINHGGDTFLFHSGIYLIPELDLGFFVSYNGRDAALARNLLFKNFMDNYYPSQSEITAANEEDSLISNTKIAGTYYQNRSNFTTYQSIIKILNLTHIENNQKGDLVYNFMGETHQLKQIAPQVFYDKEINNKLYAPTNQEGNVNRLYTNSPNALLKAEWYETLNFNLLFTLGFIVFALIFSIILIKSLFKSNVTNKYVIEKLTAVLFAIAVIGFFIAIGLVLSNTHPIYNVPYLFLEETPTFDRILLFIWIIPFLTLLLVIMNVRVWFKDRWNIFKKVIYTLYTLWSIGITGWFYYWNFLNF